MTGKASAVIRAVHAAAGGVPATVDVLLHGAVVQRLRYPVWYTPQVGDRVVVDWLGSQPYVSVAFF